tara:strand:+ start:178 stop:453 length:276 start_codon:yes stop_codon:yes gene_type:complete
MKKEKKKTKKKIKVDGLVYKVDYQVYKILEKLQSQVEQHEHALYSFLDIYLSKEEHIEAEDVLNAYCIQLPYAEQVLESIKKEKDESENND